MRTKLATGGVAALGVLVLGVGATFASFTSTGKGPTIQAQSGKLDLKLNTKQGASIAPNFFGNLKPGDTFRYFIKLANNGTVPGKAKWTFENHQEFENGCGSSEAADTSCESGPGQGELGEQLAVTFALLPNQDCTGTPRVVGPPSFPSAFSQPVFRDLGGVVLAPRASQCVRVDVIFQELGEANNVAQSDSSSFGFRFQLVS